MAAESTYDISYVVKMIKQAIEFAQIEGNFKPLCDWVRELERSIEADALVVLELYKNMDDLKQKVAQALAYNSQISEALTKIGVIHEHDKVEDQ